MAGRNVAQPLYVTCPYDVNHRLAPRSYAIHLDKCAKTSKKVLSICRYNSLHRIEPALLEYHYAEECLDRPTSYSVDWDDIPPARATPQSNEVNALADTLGAAAISDPPTESSTVTSAEIDDWDSGERHNFLAPEFSGSIGNKPTKSYTLNRILVQNMTKSQKKKFYEEQLNENLARIEREKLEREGQEKRLEMEKRREQEEKEQEEKERLKKVKEEAKKEADKKKKDKKERIKAAKRAAYLARVEQEKETQPSDN